MLEGILPPFDLGAKFLTLGARRGCQDAFQTRDAGFTYSAVTQPHLIELALISSAPAGQADSQDRIHRNRSSEGSNNNDGTSVPAALVLPLCWVPLRVSFELRRDCIVEINAEYRGETRQVDQDVREFVADRLGGLRVAGDVF